MIERVSPQSSWNETTGRKESDFADVLIQHAKDYPGVGVGLEPNSEYPGRMHFVDAIYGGSPNQTEIGKIFCERVKQENDLNPPGKEFTVPDFEDSDAEAEWYNALGRAILDSVTGSSSDASLWTWLDRPGVNRLIRILRKARDTAFGRDE